MTRHSAKLGSLYEYLPSREALVSAILDRKIDRIQKRFEVKIRTVDAKSFDELLDVVIQAAADVYLSNRKFMTIFFEQTRARKHISELLGQAIDRYKGDLKPRDLDLAIYVSANAMLGVLSAALLNSSKSVKEADLVREIRAMVRRYFIA